MKKLNVMTIVGTRPEIIRLSRVIARLEAEPAVHHILVHTGQNYDYELNEIFFKDLGIRTPDRFLKAVGANVAETIGLIIARIDVVLRKSFPMRFSYWVTPTALWRRSQRNEEKFLYFIWKAVIAVSTNVCRKRSIGRLSITSLISILRTVRSHANICCEKPLT